MRSKKKSNAHQTPLNGEESELLASFEREEWTPVKDNEKQLAIAKKATTRYLSKMNKGSDPKLLA